MDVVSLGPLPASSLLWQPRPGAWVLTVVARATCMLRPGEAPLAPSQESPAAEDRHWGDDPSRSVRRPRDLVPVKPHAEVVLVGSAYAPERRPTSAVVARLVVGEVDKSIEVVADRFLTSDGVREGLPFTQMSLAYERAAGGPGTVNPVGLSRGARDTEGRYLLPNLQRPGSAPNAVDPIGFGPIAPSWPERLDRLGAAAHGWSFRDLGRPLPEGMDLGFFNVAPRDQHLRALAPAEAIVLENLHADHPRLVTKLPGIVARATLEGRRSGPVPIAMRADTLWIDTDAAIATVVFRGMIPLEGADEQGRVIVVMDRVTGAEPSGVFKAPEAPARRYDMTADIPLSARQPASAALPFAQSRPAPAPVDMPPPPAPRPPVTESPWASSAPPVAVIAPRLASLPNVLEASNAAAAVPPRVEAPPLETPAVRPAPEPRPAPKAEIREILDLVWFDPESVPRLRRKPAWRPILDGAERAPVDPDLDDPALAKDPMLVEDRREVFEILARAEPLTAASLDDTLARCQRDDGKFVPTVALFSGELELPFDEIATLRATIGTVTPLIGTDEALRGTVDTAKELLALPDLTAAPAVAKGLTRRIEQAFSQGKRAVPADYLETTRERALIEQRKYQRRTVFGDKHLRALLRFDTGESPPRTTVGKPQGNAVPVYLPESTAALLPLQARFRARFVAEVRLAADPAESHPAALKVLALARAAAPIKR